MKDGLPNNAAITGREEALSPGRKLPANFDSADWALFAEDPAGSVPETKIIEYRDVRISPEGLLFRGRRIMLESFAEAANFANWKKRSIVKAYVQNLLLRKSSWRKDVVWATDDWSEGYFHWFADVLPKLVIASECLRTAVLLLPAKFKNISFVTASLDLLGIDNVEFVAENETLWCEKVLIPVHTNRSGDFNEAVIRQVRSKFREKIGQSPQAAPRRIYISRRKAGKRIVLNETEILPVLEHYGFQVICAEDYSFLEQVRLFGRAEYLVGIHGAGLTNMLFMPEGGSVLELRKNDREGTNCYFNMASALGINYHYQLCPAENLLEPPHSANLIVEKAQLSINLERLLG